LHLLLPTPEVEADILDVVNETPDLNPLDIYLVL
jgi:hypothetical protein